MDDHASHRAAGTDLVPLAGGNGVPRELSAALDLALGAGGLALRGAALAGRIGFGALRAGGRIAGTLPGGGIATRAAGAASRRLADDGARVREEGLAQAQRTLEEVVPAVVELIDVEAIVRRIDVDGVVRAIDVDALLARVDVDALLARIDVDELLARADVDALLARVDTDAFLAKVDLDAAIGRIDVGAIAARVDVNAIVQRVDVDAVVEQTELGTIVARSTSGFASEALDAARAQTVGADTLVTRIVERLLRRRGEAPLGPPLLVHEQPKRIEEPPPPSPPGSAAG